MRDLLMLLAVCLIIAAAIGFVLGWLFKHLFCKRKLAQNEDLWSNKYHMLESEAGGLRGKISDREATIATLKAAPPPAPAPAPAGGGDGGDSAETEHLRAELKKAEGRIVEMDKDLDRCQAALAAKASAPETPSIPPAPEPSGGRPDWLMSSPSDGEPDDLKKIWGVGPALEKTMNTLGIYYYRQVAKLSESDIEWVSNNINAFPDRIKRDRWTEQATDLHREKYSSEP